MRFFIFSFPIFVDLFGKSLIFRYYFSFDICHHSSSLSLSLSLSLRYLASKELKAQKWRFHTQHQTWFQKHENKAPTPADQEVGTYSYFDHETAPGWAIKKKEFRFDFKSFEGGEGV